jgi:hypothetical protein
LKKVAWYLPISVLLTSVTLKLIILQESAYHIWSISSIIHAILITFLEYVLLALSMALCIPYIINVASSIQGNVNIGSSSISPTVPSTNSNLEHQQLGLRLYFALLFPEAFRVIAIVLHTFDSEPKLLLWLSLLIVAMQIMAVYSVTKGIRLRIISFYFVMSLIIRMSMKVQVYTYDDIRLLGGLT